MIKKLQDAWRVIDDRLGISKNVTPIMRHPVPPKTGWWYVFGSATLFAFILQVITGIVLSTTYVPSSAEAYSSLQFISQDAVWGHVVRGLHYFGASAMILLIGIHVIRTFLMGVYKFPREANWLSGSVLLVFTLLMAFTGQLLRWDQVAIWSVVVGAAQASRVPFIGHYLVHFILSGDTWGGATLSRFFAVHVFFFPAVMFLFIGLHLYLVIHNGISEPPVAGRPVDPKTYRAWYQDLLKREGHPFWPDAAWRDVVFGVLVITIVVVLAWVIGPPALSKPPNPVNLDAYPRPDWYFLWYFAVLAKTPPQLEQPYVIVFGPLLFGFLLFALPFVANRGERAPQRRPWAMAIVLVAVIMIGVFWRLGVLAPWSPDFKAPWLPEGVVKAENDHVAIGATLFHQKGCEYCHNIEGYGGHRGPDLTTVGNRLTAAEMTIRIMNGGQNMPSFAGILKADELDNIVAFLQSRKTPGGRIITDTR
jgi:ubiquinol-cytochrome c reductase cytochrome b subunit